MSANKNTRLAPIPWPMGRPVVTMIFRHKPQHDQAVQQQGHRRSALDCFAGPALRLLEAQVAFGVVERLLDRATPGVPTQHLCDGHLVTRRVEGLHLSPAGRRLDSHYSQRPLRHSVHAGQLIGHKRGNKIPQEPTCPMGSSWTNNPCSAGASSLFKEALSSGPLKSAKVRLKNDGAR